jgi:hypothetical protein
VATLAAARSSSFLYVDAALQVGQQGVGLHHPGAVGRVQGQGGLVGGDVALQAVGQLLHGLQVFGGPGAALHVLEHRVQCAVQGLLVGLVGVQVGGLGRQRVLVVGLAGKHRFVEQGAQSVDPLERSLVVVQPLEAGGGQPHRQGQHQPEAQCQFAGDGEVFQ